MGNSLVSPGASTWAMAVNITLSKSVTFCHEPPSLYATLKASPKVISPVALLAMVSLASATFVALNVLGETNMVTPGVVSGAAAEVVVSVAVVSAVASLLPVDREHAVRREAEKRKVYSVNFMGMSI